MDLLVPYQWDLQGLQSVWFCGATNNKFVFNYHPPSLPLSFTPSHKHRTRTSWSKCFRHVYKHSHMSSNSLKQIEGLAPFPLHERANNSPQMNGNNRSVPLSATNSSVLFTYRMFRARHALVWSKSTLGPGSRNVPVTQEWWIWGIDMFLFSFSLALSFPSLSLLPGSQPASVTHTCCPHPTPRQKIEQLQSLFILVLTKNALVSVLCGHTSTER